MGSRYCPLASRFFLSFEALLVVLLLLTPTPGLPQEGGDFARPEPRPEEILPGIAHPELRDRSDDIKRAFGPHPSTSREGVPFEQPASPHQRGAESLTTTRERPPLIRLEKERVAEVRSVGATLLKPSDAEGWGYVGYTRPGFGGEPPEEVRVGLGNENPNEVEKFFLVQPSLLASAKRTDFTHQNTIEIPIGENLEGKDLTRFYQVNNLVIRDVPKPPQHDSMGFPVIQDSKAIVMTGARLANGEEVVTIFSMGDLARTGALHGEICTEASGALARAARTAMLASPKLKPTDSTSKVAPDTASPLIVSGLQMAVRERMERMPAAGRIYYYGDNLSTVDLAMLGGEFGHEIVFRSADVSEDLLETENRLEQIDKRGFDEEQLTVVDGLPQDAAAVESMGLLSGGAAEWGDFHRKVDETLRARIARHITTKKDFFSELADGQSDLLILVAHSTGSDIYLNGQKISFNELKALPPRARRSARPRLAVLISCDAGKSKDANSGWSSWLWRLIGRDQYSPLAKILVEKKFVDKVIAPDHKIRTHESLTVLDRALAGSRAQSIFPGWVSWAEEWMWGMRPVA